MRKLLIFIFGVVVVIGCTRPNKKKEVKEEVVEEVKEVSINSAEWVKQRVMETKKRLEASDASRLLWQSMEAHGGLDRWYSNGVLSFRFNYMPLREGLHRDSYQSIDTWSSRAVHSLTEDQNIKFGWDGDKAWKYPADAPLEIDARFWSLTPYYFVGVPFVFGDKGIKYEMLEEEIIESSIHQKVKVSFEDGIGDAPKDYYIVYIDEETKKVDALIYIVSYPDFFPDGGHSEEKFMDYIGEKTVNGIIFPLTYKTYLKKRKRGFVKHVTDIELTELSFKSKIAKGYFDMPEGASIVK